MADQLFGHDLKPLRETLCLAQSALIHWPYDKKALPYHLERLGRLIADIDNQRPLGLDGRHGNRHTATCRCNLEDEHQPTPDDSTSWIRYVDKHGKYWWEISPGHVERGSLDSVEQWVRMLFDADSGPTHYSVQLSTARELFGLRRA